MSETERTTGVIWITGYSASGKTTVGRKLEMRLRSDGVRTIFLDGDDLRSIFANRWGYEREERVDLAKVYFRLCSHLAAQGFTVVLAAVAMYDEIRRWMRENVPNSIEAYLDVPEEERRERDLRTKGIYRNIRNIGDLYDPPKSADLVVRNYGEIDPEHAATAIREYFYRHGLNRASDRGKSRYWESFYRSAVAPDEPSPFAEHVATSLGRANHLLDVGCGNGRDAAYFARRGHRVTAVDPSNAAIERCLAKYRDLPIRFFRGTAFDLLPESPEGFDVIYSRFSIQAMTPPEEDAFLASASRLVKPSGKVFIECRSINDPLARKGEVISPTERLFGHYRRFTVLDELVGSLKRTGFEILSTQESNGLAKFGDEDPVVIRVTARLMQTQR